MCSLLHVLGNFDITQINWCPGMTRFFYRQLSRRARRIYPFRNGCIFDLSKTVVVETSHLGPPHSNR